jgi:hypothetical protein
MNRPKVQVTRAAPTIWHRSHGSVVDGLGGCMLMTPAVGSGSHFGKAMVTSPLPRPGARGVRLFAGRWSSWR